MVKGTSKRIIVVKSPDEKLFEQAIFIIRDDALGQNGKSAEQVLDEACRIARGYLKNSSLQKKPRIPAPVFSIIGAALTGAVWLLTAFLH